MHTQALCYQIQTPTCKNKLCEQGGLHSERRPRAGSGDGNFLAGGAYFLSGAQQDGLGSGLRVWTSLRAGVWFTSSPEGTCLYCKEKKCIQAIPDVGAPACDPKSDRDSDPDEKIPACYTNGSRFRLLSSIFLFRNYLWSEKHMNCSFRVLWSQKERQGRALAVLFSLRSFCKRTVDHPTATAFLAQKNVKTVAVWLPYIMPVLPTWSQNAWNKQWVKTSVGSRRTCPVHCHGVAANLLPWKSRPCSQERLEVLREPMTFFCAWSPCFRDLLDAPKSTGFSMASHNSSCKAIAPGCMDTLQRRSGLLHLQGSDILALS